MTNRRNFIKRGMLFVPFVPNILIRAASPIPFNPQIRTVVSGGAADLFSDNFNRADTGSVGTSPWTSETDTASKGSITSNEFKIAHTDSTVMYVVGSWTGAADIYVKFSIKISTATFGTAFREYGLLTIKGAAADCVKWGFETGAGGAVTRHFARIFADSGNTSIAPLTTVNASTWYTVMIYWKPATAPAANNGICRVWWNGEGSPSIEKTDNDSDVIGNATNINFGAVDLGAGTWDEFLDDFRVRGDSSF